MYKKFAPPCIYVDIALLSYNFFKFTGKYCIRNEMDCDFPYKVTGVESCAKNGNQSNFSFSMYKTYFIAFYEEK